MIVISHESPQWMLGGLGEYIDRSLHYIHQKRGDLRLTFYTMDYPENQPIESAGPGVESVRLGIPWWLKKRFLNPVLGFSAGGRGNYILALLIFNGKAFLKMCSSRRARGAVVSVHDWHSTPAGILAAALLRLPVIYHVHSVELTTTSAADVYDRFRVILFCHTLMSRLATRVIVPTPEMKAQFERHGWAVGRIRVVPHGFESSRAPELTLSGSRGGQGELQDLRAALGLQERAAVLVFVGRLNLLKGIHTLIEALPEVAESYPNVELVALGVGFPGTDQDALVDQLMADLDIQDHVHIYHRFLPAEEVLRHYRLADICVFPSSYEPFGFVAIEAMSLGAAVILGSGYSDIIAMDGENRTAYRMTGDSSKELALLIIAVLDNPAAARVVAARGQEYVRESLTWATAVEKTIAVYEEAVTTGQQDSLWHHHGNVTRV